MQLVIGLFFGDYFRTPRTTETHSSLATPAAAASGPVPTLLGRGATSGPEKREAGARFVW